MRASRIEAPFANSLRPFQRRLRLSAFVRYMPAILMTELGTVDLALVIFRPAAPVAAVACAAALVLAFGTALGIAIRRTPSLAQTARTVDDHFGLADCAGTALQFSDAQDPISRLILTKAVSRLGAASASLLPLGRSAWLGWASLVTIAASALLVLALADGGPSAASYAETDTPNSSAGAGQRLAPARVGRAGGTVVRREGAPGAQPTPASGLAPPTSGQHPSSGRTENTSARTEGRQTGAATPAENSGVAVDGGAGQGNAASVRAAPTPKPSALSASGAGRGDNGGATGRNGEQAFSGAGRGGSSSSRGTAAGGISGGALVAAAGVPPSEARTLASGLDPSAYRTAYARAEAAIAGQRIPPRLRSYVRDYFVAIRPQADR